MLLSWFTVFSVVSLFSILLLGLYSILYILSVLTIVSVSIRYTLCFFCSHLLFWVSIRYTLCFFPFSSILTIISVSIRYTLSLTTSGIWLSKSFIVSNPFLHCSMVVRKSACLSVAYFLRPSMITLAASNPGWESNFPSSSMAVHECPGISAFER